MKVGSGQVYRIGRRYLDLAYSTVGGARLRCSWSWSCNLWHFKLRALEGSQVNSASPLPTAPEFTSYFLNRGIDDGFSSEWECSL